MTVKEAQGPRLTILEASNNVSIIGIGDERETGWNFIWLSRCIGAGHGAGKSLLASSNGRNTGFASGFVWKHEPPAFFLWCSATGGMSLVWQRASPQAHSNCQNGQRKDLDLSLAFLSRKCPFGRCGASAGLGEGRTQRVSGCMELL
jgi:hypothetical protein